MSEEKDWDDPKIDEQTVSYFVRGMRTLWQLVALERRRILLATLVLLVAELLNLAVPLVFKALLDYLPVVMSDGISWYVGGLALLMFGARITTLLLRRFVQEPIFLRAIINLESLWPQIAQKKLLALSINFHERENTGKKIAKVNKGVEKLVTMLADFFWQMLPAGLYLSLNIPIIIFLDWKLGLLFVVPLIPFVWINLRSYKVFYPQWEEWDKKKEKSIGLFCQSIINIRTIQTFVSEERVAAEHGGVRDEMCELDMKMSLRMQLYFFVMELILGTFFIATIVSGLYFVSRGWSTVGTVAYVFITGNVALQNLWNMIHVYTRMLRNLVSAERMQALLLEDVDVANLAPSVVPVSDDISLCVDGLKHTYRGKKEPAIAIEKLCIFPGEMFALVGPSGSGKSTLASLFTRTQDPTEGVVQIGGCDIRDVDRDWYRRLFAVVPQDVEVLEGSILDNIRMACPSAKDDWISQAVEAACLSEIVTDHERFPDGLLTKVGERGVRLSGGERQRVGIARAYVALLAGSRFLVLDEATSALDTVSERVVQDFLGQLRQKKMITLIVIAHRLSTILTADRICVLEGGRIIEEGDHSKLLKKNGLYAQLVRLQSLNQVRE